MNVEIGPVGTFFFEFSVLVLCSVGEAAITNWENIADGQWRPDHFLTRILLYSAYKKMCK
jgi:hypothetical protein